MLRALGTGVADTGKDLSDRRDGFSIGKPNQRIPARDLQGSFARVGIGALLHPAVLLAFADRAGFIQDRDRPFPRRPRFQGVDPY